MIVYNKSIYNYYLKNHTHLLPSGTSLAVDDAEWELDDELARAIETLDNAKYVFVSNPPVNYPRTRAFPYVVNIIGPGSVFERVGPIAIAFDDPDFATGITVTKMNPGDLVLDTWLVVPETFDASTDLKLWANARGGDSYLSGGSMSLNEATGGTDVTSSNSYITDGLNMAKTTHTLVAAPVAIMPDTQGRADLYVGIIRDNVNSPSGASQSYKRTATVTINWDDANLYGDGINLGTIPAGAIFAGITIRPITAFNGGGGNTFTANTKTGVDLNTGSPDFFGNQNEADSVAAVNRIIDMNRLMIADTDVIVFNDAIGATQGRVEIFLEYVEAP